MAQGKRNRLPTEQRIDIGAAHAARSGHGDVSVGGLERDNAGVRCRSPNGVPRSSGDMPAASAADSPPGATQRRSQVPGMNRDDMKPGGEPTLTRLPLRYQS
jgi:hypothetical protein